MKKLNTILALSMVCFSGIVSADIIANDSQSTANALNLQGQTSANHNAQLQGQDARNTQDQGQSANNAQGQSTHIGGGAAGSGIANDNSTYNNNSTGSDLSRTVGVAVAPALTTTLTETCMGSTSVGAGWSGAALSFGTTWRDHACVRRLDAREIRSYGDIQAAKEIMCDSDLVREAFKRVGRPCAEDGGSYVAVSQSAPAVEPVPVVETPVAIDTPVKDDFDSSTQDSARILKKADEAREAIRQKYAF